MKNLSRRSTPNIDEDEYIPLALHYSKRDGTPALCNVLCMWTLYKRLFNHELLHCILLISFWIERPIAQGCNCNQRNGFIIVGFSSG
jgi:hypothetical protein